MKLSEFDYNLPKHFIAQTPCEPRDHSKLMVLDRAAGKIEHKKFYDIGEFLKKGDVLVVNNSKVMAARLFGRKSTGAQVEILLLSDISKDRNMGLIKQESKTRGTISPRNDADSNAEFTRKNIWQVLVRSAKRLRAGDEIMIDKEKTTPNPSLVRRGVYPIKMKILKELEEGIRLVEFNKDIVKDLDAIGTVPLPPYIKSDNANTFKERYQTVYSKILGSAAAPTAGLHFTPELITNLKKKGVIFKEVLLHIGLDTFRPMAAENIEEHKMHNEYCELDAKTAEFLTKAKKDGRRIIAVGTTAARVLESVFDQNGKFKPFKGWTGIFIYPGYKFKAIDALITNFHLPKSSLLLMVSAFCGNDNGRKLIIKAYEEAKNHNYRFFSFGDAMMIV